MDPEPEDYMYDIFKDFFEEPKPEPEDYMEDIFIDFFGEPEPEPEDFMDNIFIDFNEEPEPEYEPISRRLNVNNYGNLIERLEVILETNPEYEQLFFTLRINYHLLGNKDLVRIHDTRDEGNVRNMQQMRLRDIINLLYEEVNQLMEMYNCNLIDDDDDQEREMVRNLEYAILTEVIPEFGRGSKDYNMTVMLSNRIYSIEFPNSRITCVLKSVAAYLNIPATSALIKNTPIKGKTFEEVKAYLEGKFFINIKIAQTIKTLEYDLQRRNERDVLLFSRNGHVGYLKRFDFLPEKKKVVYKLPSYALKLKSIIVGYDCEFGYRLVDGKHVPMKTNLVCAVIKIGDQYIEKTWKSFSRFIYYLEEMGLRYSSDVYCYAHNAQKIENVFVLKELVALKGWETTDVYNFVGRKIKSYSYKIVHGNNVFKINLMDTLCYVKDNLDNISKAFNLSTPKGHADWPEDMTQEDKNTWYLNKNWSIFNKKDVEYCMNDSKIVLELVEVLNKFVVATFKEQICKIYDNAETGVELDSLWTLNKASIASICRSIFHNLYPNILNDADEASVFKTTFFGGRNECFFIGQTPPDKRVSTIDINSSYPYQMSKGFAGEHVAVHRNHVTNKLDTSLYEGKRWLAFMVVSYKTPMKYPLLAVYNAGKLLFPNIMSPRLVSIWDVEYEAIKDNLNIHEIFHVSEFNETNFSNEINTLVQLKTTTKDPAERQFAKIMMNSIYGISGMDSYRQIKTLAKNDSVETFAASSISYDFIQTRAFDDFVWLTYKKFSKVNASFQVASSITAQARLHLWNMIMRLDSLGLTPLYCDTDSVMFLHDPDRDYFSDLSSHLDQKQLGMWDVETYDNMRVITNKVYVYNVGCGEKIKFKGLNASDLEHVNSDLMVPNAKFNVSGTKVGADLNIHNYNIEKSFTFTYNKGLIGPDGFVSPFII